MKVMQQFGPVLITLESAEEVKALLAHLCMTGEPVRQAFYDELKRLHQGPDLSRACTICDAVRDGLKHSVPFGDTRLIETT